MNSYADKTEKNKSQSIANATSQKRSDGKSSFQFIDNRPEAVQMRKMQNLIQQRITHSNISPVTQAPIQLTKLRDRKFSSPSNFVAKKIRRSAKRAMTKNNWKKRSKRNIMVVRFVSKDGKKRYNLTLRSAGMGKKGEKHPIGLNGRSAGHTEPQLAALLTNLTFKKRILSRVGRGWKIASIFSSNRPCSGAGGGTSSGCGGMDDSEMGNPEEFHTFSSGGYTGGGGPTLGQTVNGDEDKRSVGSQDSDLDEHQVRGKNLTTDDFN